jgi:hypothetical protein
MAMYKMKLNFGVSTLFGSPERTVMSVNKNDESTSFKQPLKYVPGMLE